MEPNKTEPKQQMLKNRPKVLKSRVLGTMDRFHGLANDTAHLATLPPLSPVLFWDPLCSLPLRREEDGVDRDSWESKEKERKRGRGHTLIFKRQHKKGKKREREKGKKV